jgi:hypothetical protein
VVALYAPKTTALVLETFSMRILLDLSTGLRSVKLTIPVFLKGLLSILSSGTTTTDGSVSFPRVILSTTSSLYYSICKGGRYIDEATGKPVDAPTLHSAAMYSGTGNLVLIANFFNANLIRPFNWTKVS